MLPEGRFRPSSTRPCLNDQHPKSVAICRNLSHPPSVPSPDDRIRDSAFRFPISALQETPPSTIGPICCAFRHDLFEIPVKHSVSTSPTCCAPDPDFTPFTVGFVRLGAPRWVPLASRRCRTVPAGRFAARRQGRRVSSAADGPGCTSSVPGHSHGPNVPSVASTLRVGMEWSVRARQREGGVALPIPKSRPDKALANTPCLHASPNKSGREPPPFV